MPHALRLLLRTPGFTAVAVLSLAIGIGANTAIFSLFNTVMLRSLAVANPDQLVEILKRPAGQPRLTIYWGADGYEYVRDHNHVFSGLTFMAFDNAATVQTGHSAQETLVMEVTHSNYFSVLGLQPVIGRFFSSDDPSDTNVAISWSLWNSRFHRDPSVLGQRIIVNDQPLTVIGVVPRDYIGPRVGARTDLWTARDNNGGDILARLKSGVSLAQAQAEVDVLYSAIIQRAAANHGPHIQPGRMELEPAGVGLSRIRDQYGNSLLLLLTVVGALLLLSCINLASMLLARSAGRHREIAVRVGLGAGRPRLVRQMLAESLLLSGLAAIVGVVFAYFATGVLVRIIASGRIAERVNIEVQLDSHVLLFTIAIAVLTGLLFGIAPAWYAFRVSPMSALRQTGHAAETWALRLFGKGLVTAQVAISILLVTSAAVLLHHLTRLRNFDLGFRSDHVLMATLDPSRAGYKREQLAAPYQELITRLQSIPGVRSASISGCTPIQGCGSGGRFVKVEGFQEPADNRQRNAVSWVAPKYFETLGIPLLAGRDFRFEDAGRSRVAIINATMARHYFANGHALGRFVTIDRNPPSGTWYGDDQPYEIIGIVADAKANDLREPPPPAMYFNMFQENRFYSQFDLRTSVNPASLAATAERVIHDVMKSVPVTRVITLSAQVDAAIVPERLMALLSELFAALGAVLAGIGLYGLLAYTVARRTNEIGVRMALGAKASDIAALVLRDSLGMVSAGLLGGLLLVLWTRPIAARLIHDLESPSLLPLALAGAAILAVALLASYLPARRAARVDPMAALRHD